MTLQKAPAAVKATSEKVDPRKTIKRVIVNRLNVDTENQDLEIVVNDLGAHKGRKAFSPGQEVNLSLAQIGILKDAVERHHIDIGPDSGVYSESNPLVAARQQFPGFAVKQHPLTGMLYAEKHRPNYSITEVSQVL